nr:uncharacterized protein LOC109147362 [Ipomoea trifida]
MIDSGRDSVNEDHGYSDQDLNSEGIDGQPLNDEINNSSPSHIDTEQPQPRRSARMRKVPSKLQDYYCQSFLGERDTKRTSPHSMDKFISYSNLPSTHRALISSITCTKEPQSYTEAGTRNDLDEVLTTILFNVINENGLSLPNAMTTNVLDAFTNYHNFKITVMYDRLMFPGDILGSRNKINEILRKAQEKAKEQH